MGVKDAFGPPIPCSQKPSPLCGGPDMKEEKIDEERIQIPGKLARSEHNKDPR